LVLICDIDFTGNIVAVGFLTVFELPRNVKYFSRHCVRFIVKHFGNTDGKTETD